MQKKNIYGELASHRGAINIISCITPISFVFFGSNQIIWRRKQLWVDIRVLWSITGELINPLKNEGCIEWLKNALLYDCCVVTSIFIWRCGASIQKNHSLYTIELDSLHKRYNEMKFLNFQISFEPTVSRKIFWVPCFNIHFIYSVLFITSSDR